MESGTPQLRTDTPETTPVDVSKLGFHVITTQDVAAIADHYENGLQLVRTGEEGDTVYLTTAGDHHSVAIRKGEPHGRAGLGFEINGTLEETAERLTAAGVDFERRSDPEPGIGDALVISRVRERHPDHPLQGAGVERRRRGRRPAPGEARPHRLLRRRPRRRARVLPRPARLPLGRHDR